MLVIWIRRIDDGLDVSNEEGAINYSQVTKKFEGSKKRKYKKDCGGFRSLREVSPMIHRQTRRLM